MPAQDFLDKRNFAVQYLIQKLSLEVGKKIVNSLSYQKLLDANFGEQNLLLSNVSWVFSGDLARDYEAQNTPFGNEQAVWESIKAALIEVDKYLTDHQREFQAANLAFKSVVHHLFVGICEAFQKTRHFDKFVA